MTYVRVTSKAVARTSDGSGTSSTPTTPTNTPARASSDDEDEEDGEVVELPTEEDGSLSLATLEGQFPGAVGLQFRSTTGSLRGVRICDGYLKEPEEGWGSNTLYYCVFGPAKRGRDSHVSSPTDKKTKVLKECVDLIVLGIPYSTTVDELAQYFEQFGPVATVEIKANPITGKSKGFGFVRFKEYSAQVRALSARHNIGGRWCNINLPKSKHDPSEPETVSLPNRIFVSRIPPAMAQTSLKEYFANFGEIEDVFMPNPPRGFAFVTFRDLDVAEKLLDSQHFITGVAVNVSLAMTKDSCFAAGLGKGPHRWRSSATAQRHPGYPGMPGSPVDGATIVTSTAPTLAHPHHPHQLHHHTHHAAAHHHQHPHHPHHPAAHHHPGAHAAAWGVAMHQAAAAAAAPRHPADHHVAVSEANDIHASFAAFGDKPSPVSYVSGEAYPRYGNQYGYRNFTGPAAGAYIKTGPPAALIGRGVRRGPTLAAGPSATVQIGIPFR